MADAYLNIAERVLLDARRPMRPREIVAQSVLTELLPENLYGTRQDKTLHARLSEDIAANPEKSRFFRTAPGVFFLQCFLNEPTIPSSYKSPYYARPRKKELNNQSVLTIDEIDFPDLRADRRTLSVGKLYDFLQKGNYKFSPYSHRQAQPLAIPVHSFVIVFRGCEVLSFRCGKFYPSTDPLYGKRSIGVGGAVLASDSDMTYESMWGIIGNGVNELRYGIGLPNRLAERARYENELRPFVAVIMKDTETERNVLHVVLAYKCPYDFTPTKAALSINDLRWVDALSPGNTIDDYDMTSQFLFSQDYVRDLVRLSASDH